MRKLIACCGLDCETCDARIATVKDDNVLREKTAELWSELNQARITAEMINCMGCRTDGAKTPYCDSMCGIRKCVLKKGLDTCGGCPELDSCELVGAVLKNCPEALQNLKGAD